LRKRTVFLHALIDFGTSVCTARDPNCESCPLEAACEYETERSTDE